uniref:Putative secreted protein n=1 Tax=Ixodes ricinus TaxID=34613 RepID=A0A147BR95_IXORI
MLSWIFCTTSSFLFFPFRSSMTYPVVSRVNDLLCKCTIMHIHKAIKSLLAAPAVSLKLATHTGIVLEGLVFLFS